MLRKELRQASTLFNMAKLILGTVQFGLDYGVANATGRPSFETVKGILDFAKESGIDELDTADAYGDSQKVLSHYASISSNQFKIMSKFIDDGSKTFIDYFESTLAKLSRTTLDGYYFHRYGDYEKFHSFDVVEKLKSEGRLKKFGVSLYSEIELERVVSDPRIDLIQLPFNVLDNGKRKRELLQKAHELGKIVYIRSAFLQGLLLMQQKMIPEHLIELSPHIARLSRHAEESKLSMADLCMGYLNACNFIDGILIGVNNLQQLKDNINASKVTLNLGSVEFIEQGTAWNHEMLNPAKWVKK